MEGRSEARPHGLMGLIADIKTKKLVAAVCGSEPESQQKMRGAAECLALRENRVEKHFWNNEYVIWFQCVQGNWIL